MKTVADRDIDQPVLSADRNRRLRTLLRQRKQPGPLAAAKDDRENIFHGQVMIPMKKSTSSKTRITDDRQLEKFSAHHAEALDRKPIDVVQCLQFLAHVRFPAVQIEPGAHQREQPRRVDIADDLQRIFGSIGQLVDVDKERVHLPDRLRVVPAEQRIVPVRLLLHLGVDVGERIVQQLVVIAELQKLRVGELDDLDRRQRSGGSIVHERGVPRGDDEIIGEVRQAVAKNLVAFLPAERRAFAAKHRRDHVAVMRHEIVGGVRATQLVHRKDEIVLGQERLARLGHCRLQTVGDRAACLLGLPLERLVLDELIGDLRELDPGATEFARQAQRDDAVIEQLETDAKSVD